MVERDKILITSESKTTEYITGIIPNGRPSSLGYLQTSLQLKAQYKILKDVSCFDIYPADVADHSLFE